MPKTQAGRAQVALGKVKKELAAIDKIRTSNRGYIEAGAATPIRALAKYFDDKRNDRLADAQSKVYTEKLERLERAVAEARALRMKGQAKMRMFQGRMRGGSN